MNRYLHLHTGTFGVDLSLFSSSVETGVLASGLGRRRACWRVGHQAATLARRQRRVGGCSTCKHRKASWIAWKGKHLQAQEGTSPSWGRTHAAPRTIEAPPHRCVRRGHHAPPRARVLLAGAAGG